jgi:predicted nucleic acid-binding protein
MDAVLLDTDVFSFLIRQSDTHAELYRPHVRGKTIALSFVTVGELYVWTTKKHWTPERIAVLEQRIRAAVIVPYDLELCKEYSRVKTSLPAGKTVAANDLWIATCAIRHSIPLITHNRKHFEGIPRLELISELAPPPPQKPGSLFT